MAEMNSYASSANSKSEGGHRAMENSDAYLGDPMMKMKQVPYIKYTLCCLCNGD